VKNIFLFIRVYFTFICFLVLQVLSIILLSNSSKSHEAFFASAANEVIGRINSRYTDFTSYFTLKEINRQLVEENNRLKNELKADFQSPDSSKKMVVDSNLKDPSHHFRKFTYLPAKVVGNTVSSQTNYIILERGAKQGVKKGMSVIGPEGIVGVVIEVFDNYSKAMSLLNRNSKVSAMLKNDNVSGSIEWDGADPSYLTLKNIPKSSKVAKGDSVVTSSYSANFPSNLLIGTIAAVGADPAANFYTLKIKTATNFFSLQYVYLVENVFYTEQTKLESTQQKFNE